jgi:hypothetical protein
LNTSIEHVVPPAQVKNSQEENEERNDRTGVPVPVEKEGGLDPAIASMMSAGLVVALITGSARGCRSPDKNRGHPLISTSQNEKPETEKPGGQEPGTDGTKTRPLMVQPQTSEAAVSGAWPGTHREAHPRPNKNRATRAAHQGVDEEVMDEVEHAVPDKGSDYEPQISFESEYRE